jgi:GNAT superfamily N-acetyltransferase
MDGSRNFGVYDTEPNKQVAYARMVTDGVTFARLCDVFVDPGLRGQGIGAMLIAALLRDRPDRVVSGSVGQLCHAEFLKKRGEIHPESSSVALPEPIPATDRVGF